MMLEWLLIQLRGLDDSTQEEFGNLILDWKIREHVSNTIKFYFEQQSVITQAKILHGLIKHKKFKRATNLLGFKDVKNKNACENVLVPGKIPVTDSRDSP